MQHRRRNKKFWKIWIGDALNRCFDHFIRLRTSLPKDKTAEDVTLDEVMNTSPTLAKGL